jgi:2,4-dienoyl-CoA reductase-like NADH-dependent reductase (Old Yellow Enzyme family)
MFMSHLYEAFTLRGVTFRNRIGVSPMCQYSAEDGFANDWHLVHLGSRAAGGAGLVIVEATGVEPCGRISPNDLGIWKDEHIEPLARIVQFMKEQGATAGIQLAHAGRKAGTDRPWKGGHPLSDTDGGWSPVAPSAIPFSDEYRTPQMLSIEEIKLIQTAFKDATIRAVEAGFDLIEIHGAHGYLIHSFYSPISNQRDDEYGGSFQNRIRFLMEIVQQAREVIPDDKVLAVRLSATDWLDGGWTIEDSVELARCLKDEGVDLIDCSSGGILPNLQIPVGAGYQVPLSERVRHDAQIPTATVGMITQPMQADELIRNGRADIVLLGREMLRDPYWAIHAANVVHAPDQSPIPDQYVRSF